MAIYYGSQDINSVIQLIENSKDANYYLEISEEGDLKAGSWLSHTWRRILSIFIGTSRAFKTSTPLAIAEKVEAAFNKHYPILSKGQALSFHYFFDGIAKHKNPRDCAAKINEISERVFEKVIIRPKLTLVNRAIKKLNSASTFLYNDVQKAKKFFTKVQKQLSLKINVPLPEWYHATRTPDSINGILSSGKVMRTPAFKGFGAYISSNDEAGEVIGYGVYTIAFDGEFLENSRASFFVPNPDHSLTGKVFNWIGGWPHGSIWARVDQDLHLTKERVAFFVADEKHMPVLKAASRKYYPEVPLVSRSVSKIIFSTLAEVTPKRQLPHMWKWMEGEQKCPLPKVFA